MEKGDTRMKTFVVLYDVFDAKRLRKVKELVYGYAMGGQKSAREVVLKEQNLKALVEALLQLTEKEDKVNIVRVSEPILLGKATQLVYEENGVIIV
jgi:CRISPR-associated endonuclease Cas2